jgi:predicted Rossmann fold nucleotide-binding protein DprA/Smf involved in DNA uptake
MACPCPDPIRRLVEHFGGVQNIFKASLTALEATGIQTVSTQSLGTRAALWNRIERCSPFPALSPAKNSWGPNTLIKQGAKLTARWEDVWEELPTRVRLALTPATGDESQAGKTASLFGESELPPHERQILKLLKADEATHIDEIVELLEPDLSSSEIFAALFELELAGKVKQMPGKNFVKSF